MRRGITPEYLNTRLVFNENVHNYNTRTRSDLRVTVKTKKSTERSIFHKGFVAYNHLPGDVKDSNNLITFKRKLKEKLLGECHK